MDYKKLTDYASLLVVKSTKMIISQLRSQLCGLWQMINSSDEHSLTFAKVSSECCLLPVPIQKHVEVENSSEEVSKFPPSHP